MITYTDRLACISSMCCVYMLVYALDVHRKLILRGKPDPTNAPGDIIVLAAEYIASPSVYVSCRA